jgi:hypothetical protein
LDHDFGDASGVSTRYEAGEPGNCAFCAAWPMEFVVRGDRVGRRSDFDVVGSQLPRSVADRAALAYFHKFVLLRVEKDDSPLSFAKIQNAFEMNSMRTACNIVTGPDFTDIHAQKSTDGLFAYLR